MGQWSRTLGTVTLLAVAAGLLGGCGLAFSESFEDDSTIPEAIAAVRIDGGNDEVTLRGSSTATEVSMHRKVEYRGNQPEGPTHRIEDGVLVLGGCGPGCSVEYELDLPAGLPVSGETDNGAIRLSGVGQVDVRTDNGSITVDGAAGPISVHTSNGEVELTLDTPQDVRAETENGEITATVAEGTYQVSVETDNGNLDIGLPNDPNGEHRIELTTDNGSITVRTPSLGEAGQSGSRQ